MAWEHIYLPKNLGGLGLKDLREVNKVALARLAIEVFKWPRQVMGKVTHG